MVFTKDIISKIRLNHFQLLTVSLVGRPVDECVEAGNTKIVSELNLLCNSANKHHAAPLLRHYFYPGSVKFLGTLNLTHQVLWNLIGNSFVRV